MSDDETDPCEICKKERARPGYADFDGIRQSCPRCGEFDLAGTALSVLHRVRDPKKRALLSGWVRNQNRLGSVPMITSLTLERVLNGQPPPVAERAIAILQEAERSLTGLGEQFNTNEPKFLAVSYSVDKHEVDYLVHALQDQKLIRLVSPSGICVITPGGYMHLDETRALGVPSSHGFVAMWFDEKLQDPYENGFKVGILRAGYEPVRIDQVEHVNRIDDEIIRQINASRFLVADFTGHRGGVYFEAGYAIGRGMPVFWTCRKSDMNSLHFDIRQFNCIDWESSIELANRLATRIEAVLGPGSAKPA